LARITLHIADTEEGWLRLIVTKERSEWPSDYTMDNYSTKKAIHSLLVEVHSKTIAYLTTREIDDLDILVESPWSQFSLRFINWHVIEHEIHNRGELSLILGILRREGLDV